MGGRASAASKNQWNNKAYDRINLTVSKGVKEKIAAHAASRNMSVNAYINSLISADMDCSEPTTGELKAI